MQGQPALGRIGTCPCTVPASMAVKLVQISNGPIVESDKSKRDLHYSRHNLPRKASMREDKTVRKEIVKTPVEIGSRKRTRTKGCSLN